MKGTHDFDGSESDIKTISLHDKFLAQLSLSRSKDVTINGKETATCPFPHKEAPSSAILNLPSKSLKQDAIEEDVIKWRPEKNGFPFVLSDSECGDSSYDSSTSEPSSTISTPSTPFTVQSDSNSEDFDRADIWVSSLDLDEEDSSLLSDKGQFQDIFSSDFPSPSFRAVRSLQFTPSSSSPATSHRNEVKDSDEPIFWPFERTAYNSPEFDKFLSVSPRRNAMDIGYAEVRQLNPVLQILHKNKLSSVKKSIEPHRASTDSGTNGNKALQEMIQKVAAVPSRLSRATRASGSYKQQPVRNCERRKPSHLKLDTPRKVTFSYPQLQPDQPLNKETKAGNIRPQSDPPLNEETKAGNVQNLGDKKSPIEELIGLKEFDGHEGIVTDSSDYQFSLWLSPTPR